MGRSWLAAVQLGVGGVSGNWREAYLVNKLTHNMATFYYSLSCSVIDILLLVLSVQAHSH